MKIIFWVNVYNIMSLHGYLQNGVPNGYFERSAFFSDTKYKISSYEFSLDEIEHGILRGNKQAPFSLFKPFSSSDLRLLLSIPKPDPRIHFLISCDTMSCPKIAILTVDNIDKMLNLAACDFCKTRVTIDTTKRTITLPKILNWYEKDFVQGSEIIHAVEKYFSIQQKDALIASNFNSYPQYKILYEPFQWEFKFPDQLEIGIQIDSNSIVFV